MPNTTQIECYFKSADMAALCVGSTDVVIYFEATYPPGAPPVFVITADSYNGTLTAKKSVKKTTKSKKGIPLGDGGGTTGCPKPC